MPSDWNDETAEWYAAKYGEYATNQLGVHGLNFSHDAQVVDIGCGAGSALREIATRVSDGVLIGVDPVGRMLEIARERAARHEYGSRIQFRLGHAEHLPVESGIADWVLAFDSFDHWRDQPAGLKEARRVLRSTGSFVVVKDGGLPAASDARPKFLQALRLAGFSLQDEACLTRERVSCTRWLCTLSD